MGPGDYPLLFQLSTHPSTALRWRFRGVVPTYEEFVNGLRTFSFASYLICSTERPNEVLGVVYGYDVDYRNRHCYIATQVMPQYEGAGWTQEGVALFINYLFSVFDFRKIYGEATELSAETFKSGADKRFRLEAVLKDHEYIMGNWIDLYIISIFREDWDSQHDAVMRWALPRADWAAYQASRAETARRSPE
jgi:RimJ/RimL family protein N-acetyltransferase